MFRKLTLLGFALVASTNAAFAYHKHTKTYPVSYKEGANTATVAAPIPVENFFPTSFYLGASLGSRVNYTSMPSVYTGLEGTLVGGYGGLMNDSFYLAGEVGVGDSAAISNYTSGSGSPRSTWSVAVSIIPGYKLTPDALGYVRAGIGTTNFTSPSSNSATGLLGLGLQVALCKEWELRGEYVYGFYRNMSIGTPRSQQFNLGALYRFL